MRRTAPSSSFDFDLFVIGGGSGGVRAARVSAAYGARVAIAEEHKVGGTCVIRGCVPKKLLVYGAHFAEDLADARRFGWDVPTCAFHWPTLRDNVLAGYKLNGTRLNKSRADELVEKSLRGANLWNEVKDRLDKPGSGLSGGQQQRLCIARSIAVQPDVILMDEPCSALDPISTLAVEDLINEMKENYTVIIVTHNMQQAARVADKTAFFNIAGVGKPGKLIEYDETNVIFNNPSNQQTEDYVSGRFG